MKCNGQPYSKKKKEKRRKRNIQNSFRLVAFFKFTLSLYTFSIQLKLFRFFLIIILHGFINNLITGFKRHVFELLCCGLIYRVSQKFFPVISWAITFGQNFIFTRNF